MSPAERAMLVAMLLMFIAPAFAKEQPKYQWCGDERGWFHAEPNGTCIPGKHPERQMGASPDALPFYNGIGNATIYTSHIDFVCPDGYSRVLVEGIVKKCARTDTLIEGKMK